MLNLVSLAKPFT